MRLKRAAVGACTCALVPLVVLSIAALTAAPALALPEGRVYEMVSPVYKGGYGANEIDAVALDGESAVFDSLGAFAGAPSSPAINGYLARRGAGGWTTVPLMPPAAVAPWAALKNPIDFTPTLDYSLAETKPGSSFGSVLNSSEAEILLHASALPDVAENFEVAGETLSTDGHEGLKDVYAGASSDFSHIMLKSGNTERMLPQASSMTNVVSLYDMTARGARALSLQLVALKDNGELIDRFCPSVLGGEVGQGSRFNAIADDGSEIFFTTNANEAAGAACDGAPGAIDPQNPAIVFVRLAGQRTLQVSAPLPRDCEAGAPCSSAPPMRAEFVGADETGSKVFFTTRQPLVSADRDSGNDLYMAQIGCPGGGEGCATAEKEVTSLTLVSDDPTNGQVAEVQGTVLMANDGSRVYFVARGVLSSGANAEGRAPVDGADNLYVYDSTEGSTTFVADPCSGPETSGEARDASCPATLESQGENDSSLWQVTAVPAQTAGDGRFLVFVSFARLADGDVDNRRDVYRYDAVTGTIDRVSVGEAGYDANGNSDGSGADAILPRAGATTLDGEDYVQARARLKSRAVSKDGSRVLFVTTEPLSPSAINGLENVYEWHKEPGRSEGRVSLVSTGNSIEPVNDAVISPSGRDVFFVTSQGLVPQDVDGTLDVYDERLGGGFPPVAAPAQPCSGDACQGPLTNPAPLLVPGSVSQTPGEDLLAPTVPSTVAKTKTKAKNKGRRSRKRGKRRADVHGKKGRR